MAEKKERIALGSGECYLVEFDGNLPTIEELKNEKNLFSKVKEGCELEYTASTFTEKSDDGTVQKTIFTEEEAKLRPGFIAVNSDVVSKLVSTGRVITSETDRTIVKIGGANNDNGKSYAILFYHEDKKDGDIAVLIVGKNSAGLKLAFKKGAGSILNPEFIAEPQDGEGTLIQIVFFHPKTEAATE